MISKLVGIFLSTMFGVAAHLVSCWMLIGDGFHLLNAAGVGAFGGFVVGLVCAFGKVNPIIAGAVTTTAMWLVVCSLLMLVQVLAVGDLGEFIVQVLLVAAVGGISGYGYKYGAAPVERDS